MAASLLLVFALQSWQLEIEGPLRDWDERLADRIRQPVPVTDGPAELAADLGNVEVALPVLALAMAFSLFRGGRAATLWCSALAMVCVPLVVSLLKLAFDRPGPLGGTGYYPSGHATTAMVAYGAVALLVRPYLARRAARRGAALLASLLVVATGVGLVVRGYHWPMDVTAGCVLGGLLLLGAARLSRRPWRSAPPRRASPTPEAPDR